MCASMSTPQLHPFPNMCSYKIHLIFGCGFIMLLCLSVVASSSIVSAECLIYFSSYCCVWEFMMFLFLATFQFQLFDFFSLCTWTLQNIAAIITRIAACVNVCFSFFSCLQQGKLRTTLRSVELFSDLFKGKEDLETLNLPKNFCDL